MSMLKRRNVENEEEEEEGWTSIKVRKSTYKGLIRARAYLELVNSRKISFDETLRILFGLLGELSAREMYLKALEEEGNEAGKVENQG